MAQLMPPYADRRPEHPPEGRARPGSEARWRYWVRRAARRRRAGSGPTRLSDRAPTTTATPGPRVSRRASPAAIPPSATSCSAARRREGLGSNNWVVDGTLTASGKPLLANDPHLGTRLPSTWYLAHISAGDFDVIGGTLPGTPAVALGRNRFIAWGATNVAADVEDLYRERLDASGTHAEFRGAQEPITVIPETIVVKGARAGAR